MFISKSELEELPVSRTVTNFVQALSTEVDRFDVASSSASWYQIYDSREKIMGSVHYESYSDQQIATSATGGFMFMNPHEISLVYKAAEALIEQKMSEALNRAKEDFDNAYKTT